jgi:hypothetical protein
MLNVEMLSTGDEVLHGQIVDTNAAWLADFSLIRGYRLPDVIPLAITSTTWWPFCVNAASRRIFLLLMVD